MKVLIHILFLSMIACLPGCKLLTWFSSGQNDKKKHDKSPVNNKAKQEKNFVTRISSNDDFDKKVLQAEKPVVADFSAKWCSACQALKPIFEQIAHELKDTYDFVVVDVDKAEDVAKKYGITGIPTILFFKNGKEVDPEDRHIGLGNKKQLKKMIISAFEK